MKFVPESLEESLKFERGRDPKTSMNIGLRPKMAKMLSFIHMESRDAEREYFGTQGNGNAIHALKSVLWYILYDNMTPDEAFKKACESWKLTDDENMPMPFSQKLLIKNALNKELNIMINEGMDFERGQDPKTSMGIGDVAILPGLIDSNILEAIEMFDSYTEKEYKEFMEGEDDPAELNYQFVKRAKNFLKGKITFGKAFDWKEEDDMIAYIKKYARGRYVYNASPGSDSWAVVFSKIYLPRAEEIDV
jgi:hypothetical protein